jgi:hypothetical protein
MLNASDGILLIGGLRLLLFGICNFLYASEIRDCAVLSRGTITIHE